MFTWDHDTTCRIIRDVAQDRVRIVIIGIREVRP